jgi:hypothetical protein
MRCLVSDTRSALMLAAARTAASIGQRGLVSGINEPTSWLRRPVREQPGLLSEQRELEATVGA